MKIISFAWTSPALLAGAKTVTRRDWDDDYARRFSAGELVAAYNRSPRHRGEQIATIRIVSVTKERDSETPDSDYAAEGFAWFEQHPEQLPKGERVRYLETVTWESFERWRCGSGSSWVCRFTVEEIVEPRP